MCSAVFVLLTYKMNIRRLVRYGVEMMIRKIEEKGKITRHEGRKLGDNNEEKERKRKRKIERGRRRKREN